MSLFKIINNDIWIKYRYIYIFRYIFTFILIFIHSFFLLHLFNFGLCPFAREKSVQAQPFFKGSQGETWGPFSKASFLKDCSYWALPFFKGSYKHCTRWNYWFAKQTEPCFFPFFQGVSSPWLGATVQTNRCPIVALEFFGWHFHKGSLAFGSFIEMAPWGFSKNETLHRQGPRKAPLHTGPSGLNGPPSCQPTMGRHASQLGLLPSRCLLRHEKDGAGPIDCTGWPCPIGSCAAFAACAAWLAASAAAVDAWLASLLACLVWLVVLVPQGRPALLYCGMVSLPFFKAACHTSGQLTFLQGSCCAFFKAVVETLLPLLLFKEVRIAIAIQNLRVVEPRWALNQEAAVTHKSCHAL